MLKKDGKDVKYVTGKKATEILGVHFKTLHLWEEKGQIEAIRMPGGKRLYNIDKFLKDRQTNIEDIEEGNAKLNIIYARVSSIGLQDDLHKQIELLKKIYPEHKIIKEIGSAINMNRKGLRKIIKFAIEGRINEVVIVHKDILAKFGYDLVEDLIKEYSKGEIKIFSGGYEMESEEELVKDVLTIMNIFAEKMDEIETINKKKTKN